MIGYPIGVHLSCRPDLNTSWAVANRLACDLVHRGVAPTAPSEPTAREIVGWGWPDGAPVAFTIVSVGEQPVRGAEAARAMSEDEIRFLEAIEALEGHPLAPDEQAQFLEQAKAFGDV